MFSDLSAVDIGLVGLKLTWTNIYFINKERLGSMSSLIYLDPTDNGNSSLPNLC